MRSYLPKYGMRVPSSLPEALRMLADGTGARPFAGGTDVMVLLDAGKLHDTRFVSLWKLDTLRGIRLSPEWIELGALTTYSGIIADDRLAAEFPMLRLAALETGGIATQNRGTIGGNIANASPAADTPPALLACDAELELASVRGVRRLPYASFHTGYKTMILEPDEVIAAIRLPRGRRWTHQQYRKVGTRRAQAISKVCFAAAIAVEDGRVSDVRLAFGSVAPTCVRATAAEASLRGRPLDAGALTAARAALVHDIAPIDDLRSTARYRLTVAANLMAEFLSGVAPEGPGFRPPDRAR